MDGTDTAADAPAYAPDDAAPAHSYAPLAPPPASAHRVWTVFVASLASLASAAFFTLAVTLALVTARAWRLHGRVSRPSLADFEALALSPAGLLGAGLAGCLSFALFALVPASLSPDLFEARLRLGHRPWWFAWGLVTALGMLGVGQVCSGFIALAGLEGAGSLGQIHRALWHPTLAVALAAAAIVGLGAGVGEELFFRGYAQTRLAQRWGPWASVVVSAALFGLAHLDWLHSSFAFAAGLLLGWASLRTGTIRSTMVAHVANNLVSLTSMGLSHPDERTSRAAAAAEIAAGAVMIAVCVLALRRAPRDP